MASPDAENKENYSSKKTLATPVQVRSSSGTATENGVSSITPFKSPSNHVLPPLPKGLSITVPKRRKLGSDQAAAQFKGHSTFQPLIPQKARSVSAPILKRIPSLQDTPIPDLTPAPSDKLYDLSFESVASGSSSPSTSFADTSLSLMSSPSKKQTTFFSNERKPRELSKGEDQVDEEIKELNRKIQKLKQYKGIKLHEKEKDVDRQIEIWRDASKKSSAYLYNDFKLKLNKMGGWSEFRKQTKKRKFADFFEDEELLESLEEYMESDDYKELDRYEQKEIEQKRADTKLRIESGQTADDAVDVNEIEFNDSNDEMREVLKYFGVDSEKFDLIYGDI